MSICDIIMQCTVWGSLLCTSTIDKLEELGQSRPDLLYKYKGVPVPPLGIMEVEAFPHKVQNNTHRKRT